MTFKQSIIARKEAGNQKKRENDYEKQNDENSGFDFDFNCYVDGKWGGS
jgi:hypothetical protein